MEFGIYLGFGIWGLEFIWDLLFDFQRAFMKFKRFRDWGMVSKIMTIQLLTFISIFMMLTFYFLPLVEKKLMREKAFATKSVVEVAFTLISAHYSKGEFATDEAQKEAMMSIRSLRYNDDNYFWINDLDSVTLMHPDPGQVGRDLSNVKDADGKYFMNEFVSVCKKRGEGFVDYSWPRPDSDKPVPKISYVRLFKPWGWIVGSGIYVDDVELEIRRMRFQIILVTLVLSVLLVILAYIVARIISRPLCEAVYAFHQIAQGNLAVAVPSESRQDEVGILMKAFRNMLDKLRNQTRAITEGTRTIAASISQISTTASQLAASSSETSSSVSEISVTVEEVRQTAHVSNEKAESVARIAEQSAHISERGKKATEDSVSGMDHIREEMGYISESIAKLSEQTHSIEEIINAVDDLADQSNLLSVNASIEAAKAGEHGRGFAVVAQEVKSLADQSKEATKQVKTILNDIRKAVSAAVTATERGSRAVEAGVYLSGQSDDSIDMLADSVSKSAHAAIQIAASSQEQLAGMDQLGGAMENIKVASMQNADIASQLEMASENLNHLGQNMKQLASMFKA